eukprot:421815_1
MTHLLETSEQEGVPVHVEDAVDLSTFENVIIGLKSLNLYDLYFVSFRDNAVTDEALNCLQKDDIKELIPKIGDRARFTKWLNKFSADNQNAQIVSEHKEQKVEYYHPEEIESYHPNPLVVVKKHTQGTYKAHSKQYVVSFVHPGAIKRYCHAYCTTARNGDGDEWVCQDCGNIFKKWDDDQYSGCKQQYLCCHLDVGGCAGCTDRSYYECCNQSINSNGCTDLYSCCSGNMQSDGCADQSYHPCCNKKKNEVACAKRYKCCNKAYQSKGCKVKE